jgi:hypothetical protein
MLYQPPADTSYADYSLAPSADSSLSTSYSSTPAYVSASDGQTPDAAATSGTEAGASQPIPTDVSPSVPADQSLFLADPALTGESAFSSPQPVSATGASAGPAAAPAASGATTASNPSDQASQMLSPTSVTSSGSGTATTAAPATDSVAASTDPSSPGLGGALTADQFGPGTFALRGGAIVGAVSTFVATTGQSYQDSQGGRRNNIGQRGGRQRRWLHGHHQRHLYL